MKYSVVETRFSQRHIMTFVLCLVTSRRQLHRRYFSIDLRSSQKWLSDITPLHRSCLFQFDGECTVSCGWVTDTIRATGPLLVYWSQLPLWRNANPFGPEQRESIWVAHFPLPRPARMCVCVYGRIASFVSLTSLPTRYIRRASRNDRIVDAFVSLGFLLNHTFYTAPASDAPSVYFKTCQFVSDSLQICSLL